MTRTPFRIRLKEYMTACGYRTHFSTLVRWGIPHNTALKMLKGKIEKIDFRQLALLCETLHCTPQDLLIYQAEEGRIPLSHPLQAWRERELPKVDQLRSGMSMAELQELEVKLKEILEKRKGDGK